MRLRAELWLALCTVAWGGTFIVTRYALEDASPLLLVAVRFAISTLILLPLVLRSLGPAGRAAAWRGMLLGLMVFAGFALQTVGLKYTTVTNSAFITQMLIFFTPFLQFLFLGKPPGKRNLVGVWIVVLGMYLLTDPQFGHADGDLIVWPGVNYGDLLTLACAVAFALYIIFIDKFSSEIPFLGALLFWKLATTTVVSIVFALALEPQSGEGLRLEPTWQLVAALIYLAPFATVAILYLQTRYQRDSTPTRASIIYTLEPVWATLFAVLLLAEIPPIKAIAGAAVILGGILFIQLSSLVATGKPGECSK